MKTTIRIASLFAALAFAAPAFADDSCFARRQVCDEASRRYQECALQSPFQAALFGVCGPLFEVRESICADAEWWCNRESGVEGAIPMSDTDLGGYTQYAE